ncbi:alpha-L-fucosidase [Botryobacter ruber]|uniref:alpha-L-fucosidase n=1 Tax=Botryobacter ruber TaxID=2171629 RepID=UPI00196AB7B4|nr:alpha-L-fucosidase [Botryobacter ruber]
MNTLLLSVLLLVSAPVWAQVAGDEDANMFNQAKARDQKAIDEAVNGWNAEAMKTHDSRIQWWRDAKFGMFIHWGVYSLPGGEYKGKKVSGYAEHLMRKEKITRADYLELASQFNPVKFNAEEWVKAAQQAGMKYFIVTAKHHDGFAMYDSKVSDFDIIDKTPFKRDPMAELAAACRKHGMKFGFYYSHAFDWEHPDAPGNDWEYKNPGGDLLLHGGANWFDASPHLLPKAVKYVNEKAIPQIHELITKYQPDILWFDTPHKLPLSENLRILKFIRETAPNVVVNGRLARSGSYMFGDYKNTADRPAEFYPVEGDWEAIPTTNESYGYSKFDLSHKPASFFIQLLAKSASRGGNLLMNIGPKGDGAFDEKDKEILKRIGDWTKKNGASVYQVKASPLPLQSWGVTTQKDNKLYLHVFNWPAGGKVVVGGLKGKITKAYLLTDAGKKGLAVSKVNASDVAVQGPVKAPDASNTVIVLETSGEIEADPVRLLASKSQNDLLAFDALLNGKGFGFGDGKTNRYYVQGWKSKEQSVIWKFRLNEPATYKLVLKYAGSPDAEGSYQVRVGDFRMQEQIPANQKNGELITKELGTVKLDKGTHELKINPLEIKKAELMKLLEVELIPVTTRK